VLDFSKIEAGKLDLERTEFRLRDSLAAIIKALAFRADAKGLALTAQIERDVPDCLVGDPGRLRQVLQNLIGNAVKFTDKGDVSVHVSCAAKADEELCLRFTVRDTGIGIPAEKQALIFHPFEQADTSTTRKYGGTGLGLAICSQLVSLMGGQIGVKSTIGQGSTFEFTARFFLGGARGVAGEAGAALSPAAPARSAASLRVLLAEDNSVNQLLAVRLLEQLGHSVAVAGNGQEALDALDREPFDLLLLDIQMPQLGGFEVTALIRAGERQTGRRLPIIAMTAHALKGDRDRCLAAGMDGYIAKPIQSELLAQVIDEVMGGRSCFTAAADTADQARE